MIELKMRKKIKCINSYKGDEFYGTYDEIGKNIGPIVRYFQDYKTKASYEMSGMLKSNGIVCS